jgi:hypothetical protein
MLLSNTNHLSTDDLSKPLPPSSVSSEINFRTGSLLLNALTSIRQMLANMIETSILPTDSKAVSLFQPGPPTHSMFDVINRRHTVPVGSPRISHTPAGAKTPQIARLLRTGHSKLLLKGVNTVGGNKSVH